MADKKMQVSLVTQKENIFEGWVDSIIVPAESGSLGVLPGYVPIIAQLAVGIVKLGTEKGPRYFGIQRGYKASEELNQVYSRKFFILL